MKHWLWPVLLLLTIVLAVLFLFPQISGPSGFTSDLANRPVPIGKGSNNPLTGAVYLVVIDGLRYDISQSSAMPFLRQLRSRSAWGMISAGVPSYSRASYERLLSGAPSELTGVMMNDQTTYRQSPVPTIFSLAREAGLQTAASAHFWVRELADGPVAGDKTGLVQGKNITNGYAYLSSDPDARVFAAAKDFIRINHPALVMVLSMSVDDIGHQYGGGSSEYRQNATDVDTLLADFFMAIPNGDYLAIVTADHGHRNAGGHGGTEASAREVPFFAFGSGVNPGRIKGNIDQQDIAPTVAAALGTPMAGSMAGRVLTEAFTDPAPWRERQKALTAVQSKYMAANQDVFGENKNGSSFGEVWRHARHLALLRRFLWRLPVALLLMAGILFAAVYYARKLQWRLPMLAGLAFPLYFYAILRLLRYDYSYSAVVSASDFALRAVLAAALSLFLLTWAGASLRRGGEPFFWPISLGVWTAQVLFSVLAWSVVGGNFTRFLPDLGWQVILMVQLLVTAIVSAYALAGWVVTGVLTRSRHAKAGVSANAER